MAPTRTTTTTTKKKIRKRREKQEKTNIELKGWVKKTNTFFKRKQINTNHSTNVNNFKQNTNSNGLIPLFWRNLQFLLSSFISNWKFLLPVNKTTFKLGARHYFFHLSISILHDMKKDLVDDCELWCDVFISLFCCIKKTCKKEILWWT